MTYKEFIFQYSLGTIDYNNLWKLAFLSKNKRILTILSKDKDYMVRYYIARNSDTSIEILKELSKDEDSIVRLNINKNSNYFQKAV